MERSHSPEKANPLSSQKRVGSAIAENVQRKEGIREGKKEVELCFSSTSTLVSTRPIWANRRRQEEKREERVTRQNASTRSVQYYVGATQC